MSRMPRKELIDTTEVGIYHCINRCVRRAFLCGEDALTGKNFDHRKTWIRERLEFLAACFGLDVLSYSVMSNHLHVVLRNRPDVVAGWSDEEVARRWWRLFPARRDNSGCALEPQPHELEMLTSDPQKLAERRQRLSSLSWFMRCLCEPIARLANKEDHCSGRFFEGRYRCQKLLDESAMLACSVYVDLNPIRAGIADTPETSQFTSAFDRIEGERARTTDTQGSTHPQTASPPASSEQPLTSAPDRWLSPVELTRELETVCGSPAERASNKGFLPLSLTQYPAILDWTGRQTRRDKTGAIPADLRPILERLGIASETWIDTVLNFGRWFRRAAGRAESFAAEAQRRGRRWLQGASHVRKAFT